MKLESNHTLNIEAFVDADEVDVIYQDTPYYLAPDGAMAEETFIVLREAMREAGKLAIARLVLSSRERVVTIGAARQGDVRLHAARAERGAGDLDLFRRDPGREAGRRRCCELAEALIAQKTAKFDPKAYEDRYETALMAMIKEKLKGHKPIIAADPQRGNVVNLMDALKASLGAGQAAGARARARRRAPRRRSRRRSQPRRPAGGRRAAAKAKA